MSKVSGLRVALVALGVLVGMQLTFPRTSAAQGLELGGGWAHATSNFGTDGFTINGAWFFTTHIAAAAEYDTMWDTTDITGFAPAPTIDAKYHLQNFLIGPRYYFPLQQVTPRHSILPFAEFQIGGSHLHSRLEQGGFPDEINSDGGVSWLLGGGVDYPLSSAWSARGEIGLLRTHLNSSAQSRARIEIGLTYSFGER